MRRLLALALVLCAAAAVVVSGATADSKRTYNIVFDNAFGVVEGSDVRVAGVNSGSVKSLDINEAKKAVVEVELTLNGFDSFKTDATCQALPQSLIAEFFVDCQPGTEGKDLPDGGTVPVEQTKITVQPDLVNNVLREPYAQRFQLILNEFGTGLAGNGDDLNNAIRRGAPALQQTREVLDILARQNRTIAQLNVDSDVIIKALADNRQDVVRFVEEANDTAKATAERRDDLKRQFALLPDFLGELQPTMRELANVADEQTPLLTDLRRSAGGLRDLADNLIPFSEASEIGLDSLGDAARIGERALRKGSDEISELRRGSLTLERVSSETAKLFKDLDDPMRAPEPNRKAQEEGNRPAPAGYTGFESILQFVHNLSLANSQFDEIGYFLRIQLNEIDGACGAYVSDYTRAEEGSDEPHRCVSWLGPTQPQLTEPLHLPGYDPSVCPQGSADEQICHPDHRAPGVSMREPADGAAAHSGGTRTAASDGGRGGSASGTSGAGSDGGGGSASGSPEPIETRLPKPLQDILNLPDDLLRGRRDEQGDRAGGLLDGLTGGAARERQGSGSRDRATTTDLLDFLFGN